MTRTQALLATVVAAAMCTTTSCALFTEARGTTPPTASAPASATSPVTSAAPSSSPTSTISRTPTPKPTPKDDVTQAVFKYYRVLDELRQKPPRDPYKKLFTITSGEEFDMWQDVITQQAFDGERQVGFIKVQSAEHGKITKKDGQQRVVVQTCVDVSGVDMVDKKGKSVVAKDRPDHAALKLWMITEDGSWYVNKSRDGSWKC